METLTLKLHGKNSIGDEIYRSYYLITDGGRLHGKGRASVIPMSKAAPLPTPDFIEVSEGGEEEAIVTMIDILLGLEGNQGLIAELINKPS